MSVDVTVVTNLPEVGARLEAAGAALPPATEEGLAAAAPEIAESAKSIIQGVTPHVTGALADSTTDDTTIGAGSAKIDISQPAEAPDGFTYVLAVVKGRKAIDGHDYGHPLSTPWGPRWSVKAAPANPYPHEAEDELDSMADEILAKHGVEIISKILAVMGA